MLLLTAPGRVFPMKINPLIHAFEASTESPELIRITQ